MSGESLGLTLNQAFGLESLASELGVPARWTGEQGEMDRCYAGYRTNLVPNRQHRRCRDVAGCILLGSVRLVLLWPGSPRNRCDESSTLCSFITPSTAISGNSSNPLQNTVCLVAGRLRKLFASDHKFIHNFAHDLRELAPSLPAVWEMKSQGQARPADRKLPPRQPQPGCSHPDLG